MEDPEGKTNDPNKSDAASRWSEIWEAINRAGLTEISIRLGTHILLVALILVLAWGLREFYFHAQLIDPSG